MFYLRAEVWSVLDSLKDRAREEPAAVVLLLLFSHDYGRRLRFFVWEMLPCERFCSRLRGHPPSVHCLFPNPSFCGDTECRNLLRTLVNTAGSQAIDHRREIIPSLAAKVWVLSPTLLLR